jgi:hypothetical protein
VIPRSLEGADIFLPFYCSIKVRIGSSSVPAPIVLLLNTQHVFRLESTYCAKRQRGFISKGDEKAALGEPDVSYDHESVGSGEDILALQDVDPALNAKMHLVNNVRAQKRRTSDP